MLKNRLISGILIASLLTGVTACGADKAQSSAGRDAQQREMVDEDVKPGDATEKIYDGVDVGGADTEDETTVSSADTTAATQELAVADAPEDFILFSYSYSNMAWSYQSSKVVSLNNGDVYVFDNAPGTANDQNGRDVAVKYLKEYSEPAYKIKIKDLRDLYDICKKVDPDVETERKHTACDMGSYKFTFYDPETNGEILIIETGDATLTTNDSTLKKAQNKAEKLIYSTGSPKERLYLSLVSPVNVPYGGKDLIGKNMSFDSYDKLLEFCHKNGIDVENYLTEQLEKSFKEAKYLVLQVYDTNRLVGGYLKTGDREFRFLPSLAEAERDPAFEGKVTVAITRCDLLEKYDYVNENGIPWK